MYLDIDIHKRYAQVAVLDADGEIDREVRVKNANLDENAKHRNAVVPTSEAGFVATDTTTQNVSFTQSFSERLTVFAQAQTHNGQRGQKAGIGDSITTRVDVAGTNQFHRLETIGYIALDSGEGILDLTVPRQLSCTAREIWKRMG